MPDYKIIYLQGLLLSKKEDQKCSRDSVILRHPPFCPMLHLSQELKEKVKNQSHIGVSVAVAVILGSDFVFFIFSQLSQIFSHVRNLRKKNFYYSPMIKLTTKPITPGPLIM